MYKTGAETGFNFFLTRLYLVKKYIAKLLLIGGVTQILVFSASILFVMDFPKTKTMVIIRYIQADFMVQSNFFRNLRKNTIEIEIDGSIEKYVPEGYIKNFSNLKNLFLDEFLKYAIWSFASWVVIFFMAFKFKKASEKMKSDEKIRGSSICLIKEFNSQNKGECFIFEAKDV